MGDEKVLSCEGCAQARETCQLGTGGGVEAGYEWQAVTRVCGVCGVDAGECYAGECGLSSCERR